MIDQSFSCIISKEDQSTCGRFIKPISITDGICTWICWGNKTFRTHWKVDLKFQDFTCSHFIKIMWLSYLRCRRLKQQINIDIMYAARAHSYWFMLLPLHVLSPAAIHLWYFTIIVVLGSVVWHPDYHTCRHIRKLFTCTWWLFPMYHFTSA